MVVRQISGRGLEVWQTFAVGGLGTVVLGLLSLGGAAAALQSAVPVLVFLFALFVFAVALQDAGVLDHLARWLVSRAQDTRDLPLVLFVGFGLLSSVIVNDALVLLGVPLLFALCRREGIPVRPLLLTLAYAVTVGSVLTPLGNPQNLLVSLSSGMRAPVVEFLRYLLVPTLLNLTMGAFLLRWAFRGTLGTSQPPTRTPLPFFPPGDWGARIRRAPVLIAFPLTIGTIVGTDVASDVVGYTVAPIYLIALIGAAAVLLGTTRRLSVLRRVDWSVLLLFAGL
ncbi:MAG TPA: SLC13 family permease, partial [Thermoplasmata archaeon]|nr:SLC13 family permease [Thermoplasmata archaeon]